LVVRNDYGRVKGYICAGWNTKIFAAAGNEVCTFGEKDHQTIIQLMAKGVRSDRGKKNRTNNNGKKKGGQSDRPTKKRTKQKKSVRGGGETQWYSRQTAEEGKGNPPPPKERENPKIAVKLGRNRVHLVVTRWNEHPKLAVPVEGSQRGDKRHLNAVRVDRRRGIRGGGTGRRKKGRWNDQLALGHPDGRKNERVARAG